MTVDSSLEILFLGINDVGRRIYEWLCEQDGVDVLALLTTADQLSLVRESQPDMLVSVGFGHIVPEEVLDIPSRGCINLHPSLLPYNRGANPNVWSIVEDTPAGVTLHYMTPSLDGGPVIRQREVESTFADTGKDLHQRLEAAQFELFTETWPDIASDAVDASDQDLSRGTYHTVDEFEDLCHLDPNQEVTVIDLLDRLRALTFPPYDNAYIEIDGQRYYLELDVSPAEATDAEDT